MTLISASAAVPVTAPLVRVGDSITADYGGWFAAATAAVGVVYCSGMYASAGRTVATMESQISLVTGHLPKPTYAMIEGGGNDIRNIPRTGEEVADLLESMFITLGAAGIQPIASTVLPGVPTPTTDHRTAYMAVNAWLRSYCPANGIPLVDWLPGMTTDEDEVLLDASLCVDNYHPNAAGITVMASALAEVLEALA